MLWDSKILLNCPLQRGHPLIRPWRRRGHIRWTPLFVFVLSGYQLTFNSISIGSFYRSQFKWPIRKESKFLRHWTGADCTFQKT
jgi:hypothetical protein